jgi:serpin B
MDNALTVTLHPVKIQKDFKLELSNILAQMGMPLAFSPAGADFSGMTGQRDLYISKVIHQAFIKIDEAGTEAAAATAVAMVLGMAPQHPSEPKYFIADHPFVFLVRDEATGSILLMGTLMKPEISK